MIDDAMLHMLAFRGIRDKTVRDFVEEFGGEGCLSVDATGAFPWLHDFLGTVKMPRQCGSRVEDGIAGELRRSGRLTWLELADAVMAGQTTLITSDSDSDSGEWRVWSASFYRCVWVYLCVCVCVTHQPVVLSTM